MLRPVSLAGRKRAAAAPSSPVERTWFATHPLTLRGIESLMPYPRHFRIAQPSISSNSTTSPVFLRSKDSANPGNADSGESPLFITCVTVVTLSSAIADRWRCGGWRAWRDSVPVGMTADGTSCRLGAALAGWMDEGCRQAGGSLRADFRNRLGWPSPLTVGLWTGAKIMNPSVR